MDGTIVDKSKYKGSGYVVQFKLSKVVKIAKLLALLERLEIPHTVRLATMSGCNKLQPYMIRVYGQYALKIVDYLQYKKQLPKFWEESLTRGEFISVVKAIEQTDGNMHDGGIMWHSTDQHNIQIMSALCKRYQADFSIKYLEKLHGFAKKPQYVFRFKKVKEYLI